MQGISLGCIADDFTGASDLANNLVRAGMRVVQAVGVPDDALDADAEAVVVALKSRTEPAAQAISDALSALRWLRAQGAQQIYFKYCSTFDSTPQGNIGPVAEALMEALGTDFCVATPAFPDNHRTVFKGYLFVGDVLLQESGMRSHPLTPMHDANLVRVLQAQCRRKVGLIDYTTVAQGAQAVRDRINQLRQSGVGLAVADAISNGDLTTLASALDQWPLVTGGSGLAIGLPRNFGFTPGGEAGHLPRATGYRAILAGSCSQATQAQVRAFVRSGGAALCLDPLAIAARGDAGRAAVQDALQWAQSELAHGPLLVYSSADAQTVRCVQAQLGVAEAGILIEGVMAALAGLLVESGVRQLIVAGGETAGACVQALAIAQLRTGAQIDPGVPWCHARCPRAPEGMHLALKSGNFGSEDFFLKAFAQLG